MASETIEKLNMVKIVMISLLFLALVAIAIYAALETTGPTINLNNATTNVTTISGDNATSFFIGSSITGINSVTSANSTWVNLVNASNTFGNITSAAYIDTPVSGKTICSWINVTNYTNLPALINRNSDMNMHMDSRGNWTDVVQNTTFASQAFIFTLLPVTKGTWQHYCFVFNQTTQGAATNISVTVYKNSVLEKTTVSNVTGLVGNTVSNPTNIGYDSGSGITINGSLQEFIMLNRQLTSAEITTLYNAGFEINQSTIDLTNVTLWYSMEETSGSVIFDKSTSRRNATLSGGLRQSDNINYTVPASIYTTSGTSFIINDLGLAYQPLTVNASITSVTNSFNSIRTNMETGISGFFNISPTIFILLGAVVIIGIVIYLVFGVDRFKAISQGASPNL